jgi:hypothetical protein
MISQKDKIFMLNTLKQSDPKELYSIFSMLAGWISYTLLNSIWGFLIAGYTRNRPKAKIIFP